MHPYNRGCPHAGARPATPRAATRRLARRATRRTRIPAGTGHLARPTARSTATARRRNSAEIGPYPLINTFAPIQPFLGLSIPGRHQPDTYLIEPQKNMIENDTQLRVRLL